MELAFNEESRLILATVRDFAREEIAPRAREMDERAEFAPEILSGMKELGLFGLQIPVEYEGLGVDTITYTATIEELSRACAAAAILLSVHTSVAAYPLMVDGNDDQRHRFLPRMAAGDVAAFCLSEAGAGSDAAAVKTTARRDRDDYVLNGTKLFVTNGQLAQFYLVIARTDPNAQPAHRGLSAFMVERESPGLIVGRREEKMGLRASDTMEIVFEDCRVPAANLLGEEGRGLKIALRALDNGRIGVGAQATGIAQAALDEALAYARVRQQFGEPLTRFEAIQWKLADMSTQIEAARLLVRQAAWLKDSGRPFSREAAMAKLFASEMATRAVHQALQIHGGYGYMKEYPVERYYRDVRVMEIYEGTSEMQRIVIARSLLAG